MYPNQPQPSFTPDYLNQIAPQAPKRQLFNRNRLIFGGLGLAFVIIILLSLIIKATTGGTTKDLQQLTARLQTTQTIASGAQTKLKSSELRSLNSNLGLYLTNTLRDINTQRKDEGIDPNNLDKKIVASEAATDMTNRLEDARLNAVYDSTYAREMSYQLESIMALIYQVKASTSRQSLKDFLDSTYANLKPTQTAFSDFNATNG